MHRLPWSGRATCVLMVLGLVGCKDRPGYLVDLSAVADAGAGGARGDGSVSRDGGGGRSDGGGVGDASVKLDVGGPCVKTGAPETCNGVDDDCDGVVDNVDPALLTQPKRAGRAAWCVPRPSILLLRVPTRSAFTRAKPGTSMSTKATWMAVNVT